MSYLDSFSSVFGASHIDDDFYEELEEILIGADVGFDTVMELIDELKLEVKRRNISDPVEVQSVISRPKASGALKWKMSSSAVVTPGRP